MKKVLLAERLVPSVESFCHQHLKNFVGVKTVSKPAACEQSEIVMKGDPSELSERERNLARDELIIPTGEFVALFTGALLTLGLLAGPRTLVSAAKVVLFASATTVSDVFAHIAMMGSHMDAKASDQSAKTSQ